MSGARYVWPICLGVAVGAVIAVMYRPWWSPDDATILGQAHTHGLASLGWTYSGYFALMQRAVVLVQDPAPELIGALATFVAAGLVAGFLAWRVHPIAVVGLVLAPATLVYGSLGNIQWVFAVYMIGMLVATAPTTVLGRAGDAIGLLAVGLTGPFSIILLPLYALRALDARWRWHLLIVGAAAAVQLTALATSYRPAAPAHDIAAVMVGLAAIPIVLVLLASPWTPRAWTIGALYVAIVVPVLGILGTLHSTDELLAGAAPRYFYLPWVTAISFASVALYLRLGKPVAADDARRDVARREHEPHSRQGGGLLVHPAELVDDPE